MNELDANGNTGVMGDCTKTDEIYRNSCQARNNIEDKTKTLGITGRNFFQVQGNALNTV